MADCKTCEPILYYVVVEQGMVLARVRTQAEAEALIEQQYSGADWELAYYDSLHNRYIAS